MSVLFTFMASSLSVVDIDSVILVKFTNSLVKSRPLKEIGAEQVREIFMEGDLYLTFS